MNEPQPRQDVTVTVRPSGGGDVVTYRFEQTTGAGFSFDWPRTDDVSQFGTTAPVRAPVPEEIVVRFKPRRDRKPWLTQFTYEADFDPYAEIARLRAELDEVRPPAAEPVALTPVRWPGPAPDRPGRREGRPCPLLRPLRGTIPDEVVGVVLSPGYAMARLSGATEPAMRVIAVELPGGGVIDVTGWARAGEPA